MSILHKILDHDLHKSKVSDSNILWIETPAIPEFLPSVVSSTRKGAFLVSHKLTPENRLRSGAFYSSEENLDEVIPSLFTSCYNLSIKENFPNRFDSMKAAYEYVLNSSGLKTNPCSVLVPLSDASIPNLRRDFRVEDNTLNKHCKMYRFDIPFCVFLSKPDFVGLYSRLPNNYNSILVHNIKLGMSFYVF